VLADLCGRRRGVVRSVNGDDDGGGESAQKSRDAVTDRSEVVAEVPLADLIGYSTYLRTMTSGNAQLSMKFHAYQPVGPQVQAKLLADPP
jgi:translation elongation factor EF-G